MSADLYFFILDLVASFALATAASCRARTNGAHFTGAAVLACLSGLSAPVMRDALLGSAVMTLNRGEYLGAAVAGALLGEVLAHNRNGWKVFFWFDTVALAFSAGVGAVKAAIWGIGLTGSLLLGVLAALTGGSVRDIALGDMARFVEENMYATAAAFGAMLALAVMICFHLPVWQCALCGALLTLALRGVWGKAVP